MAAIITTSGREFVYQPPREADDSDWGVKPVGVAHTPLRVDDDLARRTAGENLQAIDDVTPENTFASGEIGLQTTWIVLTVDPSPNQERERR
jgi:hypothetical protein